MPSLPSLATWCQVHCPWGDSYQVPSLACQVAKLPSYLVAIKNLAPSCQVAKMNSAEKKEILLLIKDKWSDINADFSDKGTNRHTRENAWKEILEERQIYEADLRIYNMECEMQIPHRFLQLSPIDTVLTAENDTVVTVENQ
ncbi:hypothetical protein DdX_12841 [Ditylenchus destructor]|uniref:Regulatory protein zeste n=1 Tax=Ditylenchus destructor TaxID=166010 RepID=A0AAD4QWY1_9BILA|nr:hypothetical protein DdX_12841 [Ditylenchus destructor]